MATEKRVSINIMFSASGNDESEGGLCYHVTKEICDIGSTSLIDCNIKFNRASLEHLISDLDHETGVCDMEGCYSKPDGRSREVTLRDFMGGVIEQLNELRKIRTAEIYKTTLNSFMRYRGGEDIYMSQVSSDVMMSYEAYLKREGVGMNSSSFYMRVLRAVYNRAVEQGVITGHGVPFKHVYTGIYKTVKRALELNDIKRIKHLDLTDDENLRFARDIFMFSFYTRGMSFVDIAYLRKRDIKNNVLVYCRRKTGQQLNIKCERHMQEIIDRYPSPDTQYIFPIIKNSKGSKLSQYRNALCRVNNSLKKIATMLKIQTPLTMYVARHSWGSIAKSLNIPLTVISEGLGHDSESTTQIYLSSLDMATVDNANSSILRRLEK